MMLWTYAHQGLPVPYIAAWSNERVITPRLRRRVIRGGSCLSYRDETPYDRDLSGALWVRQAIAPGRGRADFASVHALRQRQASSRLRCQVCGTDTLAASPARLLFVLRDTGQPIAEGELTTAPPVCIPCARISVRHCPNLRTGHVAAWVARPHLWGVAGVLYDPATVRPLHRPMTSPLDQVAYDDARIRWTLASRHVNALYGVVPARLDQLDPV
ncbi:hypothetical protein ACF08N_35610 [Streptomyces sp. NPDC015127]|uniref:hypothetical protein n=1 Tax=Streptomyces sp. NPDC015127 TaxID=3364939 RepID=UPI0036F91EC2